MSIDNFKISTRKGVRFWMARAVFPGLDLDAKNTQDEKDLIIWGEGMNERAACIDLCAKLRAANEHFADVRTQLDRALSSVVTSLPNHID